MLETPQWTSPLLSILRAQHGSALLNPKLTADTDDIHLQEALLEGCCELSGGEKDDA